MHLTKFAMLAGIGTVLVAALVAPAHAGILPCFFDRNCIKAPEIDPGLLRGALTALVGGGLMLAGCFGRR